MSELKWTPGPWVVGRPHPTNACLYIQPEGGYGDIATLYGADGDHQEKSRDGNWCDQPIRAANAHLIAAAPDLYDALQAMVDYCNAECGSKIYPGHQANQALAKARGETQ